MKQIKLTAHHNCDDVQLCWRTLNDTGKDTPIPKCLGFMIERQKKIDNQWAAVEVLQNRVGFSANLDNDLKPIEATKPSNVWPFQRYDWTDHDANNGDVVKYRVSAMALGNGSTLGVSELTIIQSSDWTAETVISHKVSDGISVYFNRGTVMSQFVAKYAKDRNWSPRDIAKNIRTIAEPLRVFLSGELRIAMLNLLDTVINNPSLKLYAALFELNDKELIEKLKQVGSRANIILSDGANAHKKSGQPTEYVDENEAQRQPLRDAGVNVFDRLLGKVAHQDRLGHNKFLVIVNEADEAQCVFSGSTNWTASGLCTQLNNGILIEQPKVAAEFYGYWKALKKAGHEFTEDLAKFNGAGPKSVDNIDIWFTPTAKPKPSKSLPIDIKTLENLINHAKKSVMYVMFMPGFDPLQSIVKNAIHSDKYIRGVVSSVQKGNSEKFELMNGATGKKYQTKLKQPEGIQKDFTWWIEEVVRKNFIGNIGFAITHTKMIVIDAFTDDPIVVTGSHNFSTKASQKNDENFVVIKGNKKLAEHYAVACISMYNHYRWRAYVDDKLKAGEKPWSNLKDNADWQSEYLASQLTIESLNNWCA